jgi:hypothetical protein
LLKAALSPNGQAQRWDHENEGEWMMRGTWLPRTGLLCLLAGIGFLLLWCIGIASGGWAWSPFILAIASFIVAQILNALSDILSKLRSIDDRMRHLEESNKTDPNKPSHHTA